MWATGLAIVTFSLDLGILIALMHVGTVEGTVSGAVHQGGAQLTFTAAGTLAGFLLILWAELKVISYYFEKLMQG